TSVPQNGVARSDATESDGELMQRIAAYVTDVGHRPTQREIAEALGLTRANVRRAINAEPEVWHRLGRLATAGNGQGTPTDP
ncbi:MAG: hypothetical protein GEU81_18195, partial [Nitriliruptorales bacterium]|nr:hypothetical protein [Nitriliruptorales bacterium]